MKKILMAIVACMVLALNVYADDLFDRSKLTGETAEIKTSAEEICYAGEIVTSKIIYEHVPEDFKLEIDFDENALSLDYEVTGEQSGTLYVKVKNEGTQVLTLRVLNKRDELVASLDKTYYAQMGILVDTNYTMDDYNQLCYNVYMSGDNVSKRFIKYRCGSPALSCYWGETKDENNYELKVVRNSKIPSCGVNITLSMLDDEYTVLYKKVFTVYESDFVNDSTMISLKDKIDKDSDGKLKLVKWNRIWKTPKDMYFCGLLENTTDEPINFVSIKIAVLDENDSTIGYATCNLDYILGKTTRWVKMDFRDFGKTGINYRIAEVVVI